MGGCVSAASRASRVHVNNDDRFSRGKHRAVSPVAARTLSVFAVSSSSRLYLSRSRLCGSDTGSDPLLRHAPMGAVECPRALSPPLLFRERRWTPSRNVPSVDEPTAVDAARDSSRAVASSRALPARWAGSTSGTRP